MNPTRPAIAFSLDPNALCVFSMPQQLPSNKTMTVEDGIRR